MVGLVFEVVLQGTGLKEFGDDVDGVLGLDVLVVAEDAGVVDGGEDFYLVLNPHKLKLISYPINSLKIIELIQVLI